MKGIRAGPRDQKRGREDREAVRQRIENIKRSLEAGERYRSATMMMGDLTPEQKNDSAYKKALAKYEKAKEATFAMQSQIIEAEGKHGDAARATTEPMRVELEYRRRREKEHAAEMELIRILGKFLRARITELEK